MGFFFFNVFLLFSFSESSLTESPLEMSEKQQRFLPEETVGIQQTCWSLEVEPADLLSSSSVDDKFDPCALKKKKKKKKKKKETNKSFGREDGFPDILVPKAQHLTCTTDNPVPLCQSGKRILSWQNLGEDYEYGELLSRVLYMLREDNLEVPEEKRRRAMMMPPQVLAEGIQNTVCVNFLDICRMTNRKPDHVMSFLLDEMGTRGSLDKQQRLVMKARVSPKEFEAMFRRYIDTYVVCSCCRSPDTALAEENRDFVLRCEMCGSVAAVKKRVEELNILVHEI